ncbi:MAG: hypothetical protein ABI833_22075 [Acidobacteriota bacterium]
MAARKSGNLVRLEFHIVNVSEIQWIDFRHDGEASVFFRGSKNAVLLSGDEFAEFGCLLGLEESKATRLRRKATHKAVALAVAKSKKAHPESLKHAATA